MDKGEDAAVRPRGWAGGRSAEEQCAADFVGSTGFPRRIIAPVGGVTLSHGVPSLSSFSIEDYIRWVSTRHGKKLCNLWFAACGGQYSTDRSEVKVFRAHAPPQGACENLVCALQLLANQQLGGDSLVYVLVEGLQERSRLKMIDEPRRFTEVDHQVVKIGDLEKHCVALHEGEPKFNKEDIPEAVVRERVQQLTLRRGEERYAAHLPRHHHQRGGQ